MAKINVHDEQPSVPGMEESGRSRKDGGGVGKSDEPVELYRERGPRRGKKREGGAAHSAIHIDEQDDVNIYAQAKASRHDIDERLRPSIILVLVLVVVFIIACVMPTGIFDAGSRGDHSVGGYAGEVSSAVQGLVSTLSGGNSMYSVHFFEIVAALLAGGALGVAGCVYQGAFKNPLAGPSTLGISNGGTLGIIIFVTFIYPYTASTSESAAQAGTQMSLLDQALQTFGTFISSLIGCAVVVVVIMAIALMAGRGKVSNASLVIAGQVFAAVIGVVIAWIHFYLVNCGSSDQADILLSMQTATFTGTYNLWSILLFAVPTVLCAVVLYLLSPRLGLLAFKDEEARSMGISTARTRNTMIALCTVMTALVISFCGPIGFVGFMVPHLARRIVGPDFRFLLPASAVLGAILVVVVNMITYMGIPGIVAGSTGVVTGLVGCAMFLIMIIRKRGAAHGQWL